MQISVSPSLWSSMSSSSHQVLKVERPSPNPCANCQRLQLKIEKLTILLKAANESSRNRCIIVNSLQIALKNIEDLLDNKVKDCKGLEKDLNGLCWELRGMEGR